MGSVKNTLRWLAALPAALIGLGLGLLVPLILLQLLFGKAELKNPASTPAAIAMACAAFYAVLGWAGAGAWVAPNHSRRTAMIVLAVPAGGLTLLLALASFLPTTSPNARGMAVGAIVACLAIVVFVQLMPKPESPWVRLPKRASRPRVDDPVVQVDQADKSPSSQTVLVSPTLPAPSYPPTDPIKVLCNLGRFLAVLVAWGFFGAAIFLIGGGLVGATKQFLASKGVVATLSTIVVTFAIAGLMAIFGHVTLYKSEQFAYRASRIRPSPLADEIIFQEARHTKWLRRFGFLEFSAFFALPVWGFFRVSLSVNDAFMVVLFTLLFGGMVCLLGIQLRNFRTWWNFESMIVLSPRGICWRSNFRDKGRTIPWTQIESVGSRYISAGKYPGSDYLILRIPPAEGSKRKAAKSLWQTVTGQRGDIALPLTNFLESPRTIIADAQAFYDRYGQAQTAT